MTRKLRDLVAVALLAGAASTWSWQASQQVSDALNVTDEGRSRRWFGTEVSDVLRRLTADAVDHDRVGEHPLATLGLRAPVSAALILWPEANASRVVRTGLALASAVWMAGLFLAMRLAGLRRLDAVVFAIVALVSASAVFWLGVPDLAVVTSLTIVPVTLLVAARGRARISEWWTVGAVALSLGLRPGLGVIGLLGAVVLHPWRRARQVGLNAIGVVIVLLSIQQMIFPAGGNWFGRPVTPSSVEASSLWSVAALGLNAMVMPAVGGAAADQGVLSIRDSWPGSAGPVALVALLAWVTLLAAGAFGRLTPDTARLRAFVLGAVAIQWVVSLLAVGEAFRLGLEVLPLLILLASLGAQTNLRPVVLGAAVVLAIAAGVNNHTQFLRSLDLVRPVASAVIDGR